MRTFIAIAALVLLAGCESNGDGWRAYHDMTGAEPERATPVKTASTLDAHCVEVAKQRSMDARENGYSIEMEDTIYQGTYSDCAAWDAQHPQWNDRSN